MINGLKVSLMAGLLGWSLSLMAAVVDLNSASAEQLAETLSGIGMVKAQEIVRYRDQYGPFKSVDQLVAVKGVGELLLERNRDYLSVGAVKAVAKK